MRALTEIPKGCGWSSLRGWSWPARSLRFASARGSLRSEGSVLWIRQFL